MTPNVGPPDHHGKGGYPGPNQPGKGSSHLSDTPPVG